MPKSLKMQLLDSLLERKNKKLRKPYGHDCPKAVQEFYDNRNAIIHEWNNYTLATKSAGVPIDELSDDQRHLNEDKKWNALFIAAYGHFNPKAEPYFPKTIALARKWQCSMPLVFFSTLEPNKHIPPHEGNNHGVLRSQIGIDIGQPEYTSLKVSDKTFILKTGEILTFDDTFVHEASNQGSVARTVLILDSIKPFPHIYNFINRRMLGRMKKTPYVQTVIERLKQEVSGSI